MRRLVLHPGDRVPGSPDSRMEKYTRGPIYGLMRPPPLSMVTIYMCSTKLVLKRQNWQKHFSHWYMKYYVILFDLSIAAKQVVVPKTNSDFDNWAWTSFPVYSLRSFTYGPITRP